MSKDIAFVDGSENVFADIGVRDPEESRVRADLARQIAQLIRKRRMRQTEVATILGVDQPKVSKLVRGRISGFTSDRLIRFLKALRCNVGIEVTAARTTRRVRGKVEVGAV